jgi:hypothetical protein
MATGCRFDYYFLLVWLLTLWKQKEISTMKKKDFLDLLTSVDVLNTIHGGVSEPQLEQQQDELGRQLRIRVPGIDKETIHVEIHNNTLSIFYFIPLIANNNMVQMPCLIYNKTIPYFIDTPKINSHIEDEELIVELPFNESANGYHKKIEIKD